jgi:hypothetical protein
MIDGAAVDYQEMLWLVWWWSNIDDEAKGWAMLVMQY